MLSYLASPGVAPALPGLSAHSGRRLSSNKSSLLMLYKVVSGEW